MNLFVYGTLLSSVPSSMAKFLRRRAKLIGQATINGTLFDLGMYPGLTTGGSGEVVGEVYALDASRDKETLEMIDSYEGVMGEAEDEYRHEEVTCRLADGKRIAATTYVLKKPPGKAAKISGGDYEKLYKSSPAHQKFVAGG